MYRYLNMSVTGPEPVEITLTGIINGQPSTKDKSKRKIGIEILWKGEITRQVATKYREEVRGGHGE